MLLREDLQGLRMASDFNLNPFLTLVLLFSLVCINFVNVFTNFELVCERDAWIFDVNHKQGFLLDF